jgi:hypothetical protein
MTAAAAPNVQDESPLVRHFRSIVLWPLQLVPQHGGRADYWDILEKTAAPNTWRPVPYGPAGPDLRLSFRSKLGLFTRAWSRNQR